LDVHDVCTGIDPDVDTEEILDAFVRDAFAPHSSVVVSCNGDIEDKISGVVDTIDE
jgi:hypothetical protein